MSKTNKPKQESIVDVLLHNIIYHSNELNKAVQEKKKWEEIIKKNSNERTYI